VRSREARYTALLHVYPKAYRERRGAEILTTLLEDPMVAGRLEAIRVVVNIVAHGLRLRLGITSDRFAGQVLDAAALPGMMLVVAMAIVMPFFGQFLGGVTHDPGSFGPDTAIVPGLFILWIIGGVGALSFPTRKRLFAAICVITTLATKSFVTLLGSATDQAFLPTEFSLFVALALPCLLAPPMWNRRSPRLLAVLVGVLTLIFLVGMSLPLAKGGPPIFYVSLTGDLTSFMPFVAGGALLCIVAVSIDHRRVSATALALLTVPLLLFTGVVPENHRAAIPNASAEASLIMASIISLALLGSWLADLWVARQTIR
jgi:hypothetical protein